MTELQIQMYSSMFSQRRPALNSPGACSTLSRRPFVPNGVGTPRRLGDGDGRHPSTWTTIGRRGRSRTDGRAPTAEIRATRTWVR